MAESLEACSGCGRGSMIKLRYNGLLLCKRCFISFFERRVRRTIGEHRFVEPGDRIVVALSGGKDSVTVLYLLDKLNRLHGNNIELVAISIDQGIRAWTR